MTVGVHRIVATLSHRLKAAAKRCKRIRVLNKFNKKASRLYFTGAWPQATYGIEVYGVTPRHRARLRANAARAAGMELEDALSRPQLSLSGSTGTHGSVPSSSSLSNGHGSGINAKGPT